MFPQSSPQKYIAVGPSGPYALGHPFPPGCDAPGYCPPDMKQDKTEVIYIYKVSFQNSNKNTCDSKIKCG